MYRKFDALAPKICVICAVVAVVPEPLLLEPPDVESREPGPNVPVEVTIVTPDGTLGK